MQYASSPANRSLAFSAAMAARILLAMLRTVMIRLIPRVDTNSAVVIVGRQSISHIAVNHLVSAMGEIGHDGAVPQAGLRSTSGTLPATTADDGMPLMGAATRAEVLAGLKPRHQVGFAGRLRGETIRRDDLIARCGVLPARLQLLEFAEGPIESS